MKQMIILVFLQFGIFLLGVMAQDNPTINHCLDCHLDLDEKFADPAELFSQDIHFQVGYTCADCHGGDPTTDDYDEAKNEDMGYIGIPEQTDIPELCGNCHSDPSTMIQFNPNIPVDQTAKYWTSQHGESLKKGNTQVATCTSCHGVHGILSHSDSRSRVYPGNVAAMCTECHGFKPLMDQFDLPIDVYDDYAESVHGKAVLERGDFSAPTCNDCHGNHGAKPPDVVSVKMVCGKCHVNNFDLFRRTKMSQVFEMRDLHACEVCHNNHRVLHPTDDKVSVEEGGVCIKCHRPGDEGYTQSQSIQSTLVGLKQAILQSQHVIADAENKGMDVTDVLFDIQSAIDVLIRSRTMIHTFDAKEVENTAEPGMNLTSDALRKGQEAIVEYKNRRVWLGISMFFITFLSVILYVYIRKIESD